MATFETGTYVAQWTASYPFIDGYSHLMPGISRGSSKHVELTLLIVNSLTVCVYVLSKNLLLTKFVKRNYSMFQVGQSVMIISKGQTQGSQEENIYYTVCKYWILTASKCSLIYEHF